MPALTERDVCLHMFGSVFFRDPRLVFVALDRIGFVVTNSGKQWPPPTKSLPPPQPRCRHPFLWLLPISTPFLPSLTRTTASRHGGETWDCHILAPLKTLARRSRVSFLLLLSLSCIQQQTATHLSTYIFDGARADITKTFSMNPLFQATHSFALGSQTAPPSYNFTAIYATPSVRVSSSLLSHNSQCSRFSCKVASTTKATSTVASTVDGHPTTSPRPMHR